LLELDFVWILDDNLKETRQMNLEQIELHQHHDKEKNPTLCRMYQPMQHIESIILAHSESDSATSEMSTLGFKDGAWNWVLSPEKGTRAWKKFCKADSERTQTTAVQNLADYTGHSSAIGIMGMHRCWQEWMRITNPFSKTHSVYSFILLNVRDTVDAGVLYSPKPAWEDVDFAFDLMDKGFEVIKVNRWFHSKVNMQPALFLSQTGESELVSRVFHWPKGDNLSLKILDGDPDAQDDWTPIKLFLGNYVEEFEGDVAIFGTHRERRGWQDFVGLSEPDVHFKYWKQSSDKTFQAVAYHLFIHEPNNQRFQLIKLIQDEVRMIQDETRDDDAWADLKEVLLVIPLDAVASGTTQRSDIEKCLPGVSILQILTTSRPTSPNVDVLVRRPKSIGEIKPGASYLFLRIQFNRYATSASGPPPSVRGRGAKVCLHGFEPPFLTSFPLAIPIFSQDRDHLPAIFHRPTVLYAASFPHLFMLIP
jgi:hypothetical protein